MVGGRSRYLCVRSRPTRYEGAVVIVSRDQTAWRDRRLGVGVLSAV